MSATKFKDWIESRRVVVFENSIPLLTSEIYVNTKRKVLSYGFPYGDRPHSHEYKSFVYSEVDMGYNIHTADGQVFMFSDWWEVSQKRRALDWETSAAATQSMRATILMEAAGIEVDDE